MSTANFRTQDNFPLYCYDDSELEWWEAQDLFNEIKADMDDMNDGLRFFRMTVESGYYTGVQFFVEMTDAAENAGFDEDGATRWCDNEACRYYLDMYRSEAIRKFDAEQRKVNKLLKKLAEFYGFERYFCRGRFSNGEAIYVKADETPRAKILEAVSA